MTLQRWGALASFGLAVAFVAPHWVYLTGDLRQTLGPLSYDLADFLFGPLWAACLVLAVLGLRDRLGERAAAWTSLALWTALVAATAMVGVAAIRSANRHYHLAHPELHLEEAQLVLVVWTSLVAAVYATGWQALGWSYLLLGAAGWRGRRLARPLCLLYLPLGAAGLFLYLQPSLEGLLLPLAVVASLWQGALLWRNGPGDWPTGGAPRGGPGPG